VLTTVGTSRLLLQALRAKTGISRPGAWTFVLPYGIGDTYMVCALAAQARERLNGDSCTVVVRRAHADIPAMFLGAFSQVAVYDQLDFKRIAANSRFKKGYPIVFHPNFQGLDKVLGYGGFNLLDSYRVLFGLPRETVAATPVIQPQWRHSAEARFDQALLPRGRTVLLVPDAATVQPIDNRLWLALVRQLTEQGYTVATNVPNNALTGLPGTVPLTFPLCEAIPIVELAGRVISLRSGFCDLIATARCTHTVLYPEEGPEAPFDGFTTYSLRLTGLCDRAYEQIIPPVGDWETLAAYVLREGSA